MPHLNINLNHLEYNYKCIRSRLNPETKLVGVVKAGGYGSEPITIAKRLVKLGVDFLAVAYAPEGAALRKSGVKCPIMVFYPQKEQLPKLIEYRLEPCIYSQYIWDAFTMLAQERNLENYPIHIKYNTGLNRIGFSVERVNWVLNALESSSFSLQSVYSHLAATEDQRPSKSCEKQIEHFLRIKKNHQKRCSPKIGYHLLNSSGVFNYPEYQFDAVRCGISLYGYANRPEWDTQLKPVAALYASIAQIHTVNKGDSVGYNNGWIATRPSRIATLPIGHADGIGRHFGHHNGWVTIRRHNAPIVGNVCMDMLMADITEIDCHEGDSAQLFGDATSATQLAKSGHTISYELLAGLGSRIERRTIS